MFVAIENIDMDAFKVEEWINTTRKVNGGVILPEFAMEILTKTNHFAHIKKVLKNITKACSDENGVLIAEKVLAYKEFILSSVDRREMSPQAMSVLQEIAEKIGCKDEFDEVNDKTKIYELKDCGNVDVKIVKSKKEFLLIGGENLRIFYDADDVNLSSCEFNQVKSLKFKEGAKIDLSCALDLPEDLDFSMCSEVNLIYCDLKRISFKFREGSEVYLCGTYNLPKELDLSIWSKVNLYGCYLDGVEKIKFREGADVDFGNAHYLPEDLDLSICSKVDLRCCDLTGVERITFGEGAEVNLLEVNNLPKDLDVSMCSVVNLSWCDLKGLNLKFKEGADVDLSYAENLPKVLDLSMCSKVSLINCDLSGVEVIKFKDKAQQKKFMERAESFSGKVEYVGDKDNNIVSVNSGRLEM